MIYQSAFVLLCILPSLITEDNKLPTDYILCRQCGAEVAAADAIINLRSPAAVSRFNSSLFGVHRVLVQELVNPLSIKFKVISVLESACITTAKNWVLEHSWFPGYAWKPCICSHCKKHIGCFRRTSARSKDIIDSVTRDMAAELTDEQAALLAEFEEEFASRYTESDPDYRKVLEPSSPPVVHPWYGPRRNFDRRDRDGWRGKQRHDRHYNHHRHQPYHRYR